MNETRPKTRTVNGEEWDRAVELGLKYVVTNSDSCHLCYFQKQGKEGCLPCNWIVDGRRKKIYWTLNQNLTEKK